MITKALIVAFALVVSITTRSAATPPDCEPARCAVQAAIAECPCAVENHGRYVSCVAHAVNKLAKDGTIPTNCKGKIRRCAARSTCGKPGFVTCFTPTDTCNLTTGTCVEDPTVTCTADLDCGSRCHIKSSSDLCLERGGVPGTGTSCCADCAQ